MMKIKNKFHWRSSDLVHFFIRGSDKRTDGEGRHDKLSILSFLRSINFRLMVRGLKIIILSLFDVFFDSRNDMYLDLSDQLQVLTLTLKERAPGGHWTGSCVDLGTVTEKSLCTCQKLRSGRPLSSRPIRNPISLI